MAERGRGAGWRCTHDRAETSTAIERGWCRRWWYKRAQLWTRSFIDTPTSRSRSAIKQQTW